MTKEHRPGQDKHAASSLVHVFFSWEQTGSTRWWASPLFLPQQRYEWILLPPHFFSIVHFAAPQPLARWWVAAFRSNPRPKVTFCPLTTRHISPLVSLAPPLHPGAAPYMQVGSGHSGCFCIAPQMMGTGPSEGSLAHILNHTDNIPRHLLTLSKDVPPWSRLPL